MAEVAAVLGRGRIGLLNGHRLLSRRSCLRDIRLRIPSCRLVRIIRGLRWRRRGLSNRRRRGRIMTRWLLSPRLSLPLLLLPM